eukprot:GHVU01028296.1.p1 GENE.GHVU01028296.1~~GHVU01028296.1.p1  ORF type:complete len:378 (-),score=44.62 GHVU01028296.1:1123-2256(-)
MLISNFPKSIQELQFFEEHVPARAVGIRFEVSANDLRTIYENEAAARKKDGGSVAAGECVSARNIAPKPKPNHKAAAVKKFGGPEAKALIAKLEDESRIATVRVRSSFSSLDANRFQVAPTLRSPVFLLRGSSSNCEALAKELVRALPIGIAYLDVTSTASFSTPTDNDASPSLLRGLTLARSKTSAFTIIGGLSRSSTAEELQVAEETAHILGCVDLLDVPEHSVDAASGASGPVESTTDPVAMRMGRIGRYAKRLQKQLEDNTNAVVEDSLRLMEPSIAVVVAPTGVAIAESSMQVLRTYYAGAVRKMKLSTEDTTSTSGSSKTNESFDTIRGTIRDEMWKSSQLILSRAYSLLVVEVDANSAKTVRSECLRVCV